MHISLLVTKLQAAAVGASLASAVAGALLHKLSLKFHVRLTRSEVDGAAKVIEAVAPAVAPEVEAFRKALDADLAKAQAVAPAPAPAAAPVAPQPEGTAPASA